MATAGVTDEGAVRKGAAPSAVAMAVLGVEGALLCAVLFLLGLGASSGPGGGESATAFAVAPLLLVLVLFAATVLTVAYVLPAVALAHWTARQLTGRTAWWWVPPACTLWVLPALAVPSLHLPALAVYATALPPALAAHHTLARADMGRPVQPCAAILTWGALAVLCVVVVGGVVTVAGGG
ncbi:hypothetical protein F9278_20740 [Streptomyces phaeolivaceus]|uniref:Uncharacterized protein n=1 Tax=Streptomyces phaeolivaceus TaxID=2653200 RepID=A0A5P8K4P6_9ACTN|nr:hypothetical protein [Streptomyces phaeolivaceus]QFQ98225.1 hypothetical protein F9278_20740 [Streptomyces phaeolivaceus]